jgi:flagellar basal-body rod modification protein FlgD
MQILGTSAVSHATQSQSGTNSPNPSSDPSASLTSESTFLQLLVAQIKNQDPLNPTDSIQFVGQLVQYSELEQLIGINQGVTSLAGGPTPANGTSSS